MLQKSGFYVSSIKTIGFGSLLLNTRSKNELKTIQKSLQKLVRFQIALLSAKSFENYPKRLPNRSNFGIIFWCIFVFLLSDSKWGPKASPDTLQTLKMTKNGAPRAQNCSKNDNKWAPKRLQNHPAAPQMQTSTEQPMRKKWKKIKRKNKHCHRATQTQKTLEVRRSRASVLNNMGRQTCQTQETIETICFP